ncbi:MAG: alpha/beta hydrolase [Candidatus Cloacimonetes bacterium]|nr:alpha/beta hydrolase [Candidatus Cloacimonadota bacterium]
MEINIRVFLILFLLLIGVSNLSAIQVVFDDYQYSFQLLRTMGYSCTGGADVGECLSTAYKIEEKNHESWFNRWHHTAERLEAAADSFSLNGHNISAREAYFRASNYYRTAAFFLSKKPLDERILTSLRTRRDCFQKAMQFSDFPIEFVHIPFENTHLPGYLLLADNEQVERPVLIVHSGFDGTAEELYFEIGKLAVERGYNCLLFEGPGQGSVVYEQHIPFRPNWESVVTPVVDYALSLPQVYQEHIALMGISFGGYFAPRAVAFEDRIQVCIANGGIYNFYGSMISKFPYGTEKMLDDPEARKEFDKQMLNIMNDNVELEFFFSNGMFTFHAQSPSELLLMMKPYNLEGIAEKITCSMLVVDSEQDHDLQGQAKQLFDVLTCDKEYMLFTTEEAAEEHCQMGAVMISGERILNWLDDYFMNNN